MEVKEYYLIWKEGLHGYKKKVLRELAESVNEMIQYGWQPQGGVTVQKGDIMFFCAQAMVKREED